ncbi:hypothetical protein PoB_005114900 [Plakobranchus ocellatus]|uniref:Uncharacterized protein n=1 Tax=Plakobranchus ocellatus TaxID=259542 RepID=A0AAV4C1U4_9GAST|nr:hypothetical protein PoB_005114900 [Plakobranchus ocellatus]
MTFDKTFNLTDVHVTAAVYKNVALFNSRIMEHSGSFGAFFLHGNYDFRVFSQFFKHIPLEFADSFSPALGSDKEKAIRNAMAFACPDAGMLKYKRDLHINCVNYHTDKIGVPYSPKMRLLSAIFGDNDLVHSTGGTDFETRLELAYREMHKAAPEFISFFETHVALNKQIGRIAE